MKIPIINIRLNHIYEDDLHSITMKHSLGEIVLTSTPDVAPALRGSGIRVFAEVPVLRAVGLKSDAEVHVEQADVALGARAGRVHDLVIGDGAVRRDVLAHAAGDGVSQRAPDRGLYRYRRVSLSQGKTSK